MGTFRFRVGLPVVDLFKPLKQDFLEIFRTVIAIVSQVLATLWD